MIGTGCRSSAGWRNRVRVLGALLYSKVHRAAMPPAGW